MFFNFLVFLMILNFEGLSNLNSDSKYESTNYSIANLNELQHKAKNRGK